MESPDVFGASPDSPGELGQGHAFLQLDLASPLSLLSPAGRGPLPRVRSLLWVASPVRPAQLALCGGNGRTVPRNWARGFRLAAEVPPQSRTSGCQGPQLAGGRCKLDPAELLHPSSGDRLRC
jgi:hypothetical protein